MQDINTNLFLNLTLLVIFFLHLQISKSQVLNKVEAALFEEYINAFAMKMYRHLVELYGTI